MTNAPVTSRVVIVTGASSGLGFAMATALLKAGHRVVATAPTAALLESLADAGTSANLLRFAGDVRSFSDCAATVAAAIATFGRLDALINNAGISLPTVKQAPKFYQLDEASWRDIFETNMFGNFFMARHAAPHLIAGGWGRILNVVTSISSITRGTLGPYGPSKAAIEAATVAWSEDLRGTGVTVNAILPGGPVDLPRISAEVYPDRSKLVKAEVMAAPACWFLTAAADGITGQRIVANQWDVSASDADNLAAAVSRASPYVAAG